MRKVVFGHVLIGAAIAFSILAQAQDYPSNAIKIIVPSAPGATTDALARIVAEKLQKKWSQPVIVENRSGAAGNIGAEHVIKATPDGYTLLFSYPAPLVSNKSLYARLPYDPDAFLPISLVGRVPMVLVVHPKIAANSVQQLIAFAKANPDRLNYGSAGSGTLQHLSAELFKLMAGVKLVHVPYKGSAPAFTDLLAGHVDTMFVELSSVHAHISAGKLRVLSIGAEKRSHLLPNVPAMAEVLPGYLASTWFGMVAPPKTPSAIVNKLSSAVAEAIQQPDIAERLSAMSLEIIASTPTEMAGFLRDERERWATVIRATGTTAQ